MTSYTATPTAEMMSASPKLLAVLERILYAHDMNGNGASNHHADLDHQLACAARHAIREAGGFTSELSR